MSMDTQGFINFRFDLIYDLLDFIRERSAVGIAEAEDIRSRTLCCLETFHSVGFISFIAVKEVFGVKDDLFARFFSVSDSIFDHVQVLFKCGFKSICDMEVPALAEDGNHRSICSQKGFDILIVLDLDLGPSSRGESHYFGILQRNIFYGFKELDIFGIRSRPSAFDVVDAQLVEKPGDLEFILKGKGYPLGLRAVS